MSRVIHAVYTVTHSRTLCGRQWRLDPKMNVETLWVRVSCKQCREKIDRETDLTKETEVLLATMAGER